jgi:hypothetical protein
MMFHTLQFSAQKSHGKVPGKQIFCYGRCPAQGLGIIQVSGGDSSVVRERPKAFKSLRHRLQVSQDLGLWSERKRRTECSVKELNREVTDQTKAAKALAPVCG